MSQSAGTTSSLSLSQKNRGSGNGKQAAGQEPLGFGDRPQNRAEGSGKPVRSKVQTFEEEDGFVTAGTSSADLIKRFWAIAAKKDFMGKPENAKDDAQWMSALVKMHGVEKIKLALEHVARSDYWGATEKGKLSGIPGFQRALETIYKQADTYLTKVKQSALAKKMGGEL